METSVALSPNFFDHHPLVNIPMGSLEATNILGHVVCFGMDFLSLTGRVFMAHDASGHELAFLSSRGSSSSSVGSAICDDKSLTKSLLSHYGIPSAPSRRVLSLDSAEATEFVEEHGWPVVVKPIRGIGGKGVTANIQTLEQLQRAAQQASGPRGYLIERHVPGDDYRFLVLAGRVIGVWGKTAANVVGDGKSSISELIDLKNQIRANNPHVAARLIKKDTLVRDHLEYSGLDLEHVPDEGTTVTLRSASNLSSGGDNVEITDSVHPSFKDIAVEAAAAIPDIELLGLDILLEDPFRPADEQQVNICEINHNPGISAHDFPLFGPPRETAREYIEHLLARKGAEIPEHRSRRSYRIVIEGSADPEELARLTQELEEKLSLTCSSVQSLPEGPAFDVEGSGMAIATMVNILMRSQQKIGSIDALSGKLCP